MTQQIAKIDLDFDADSGMLSGEWFHPEGTVISDRFSLEYEDGKLYALVAVSLNPETFNEGEGAVYLPLDSGWEVNEYLYDEYPDDEDDEPDENGKYIYRGTISLAFSDDRDAEDSENSFDTQTIDIDGQTITVYGWEFSD